MDKEGAQSNIDLSSFLSESDIVFNMEVPSAFNVVRDLVSKIVENHLSNIKIDPIVDAVLHRERTAPTVVGAGIALPHARIEGLSRPYLALGIYPSGLQFAIGEAPVKLVFLLLVPENQPARYLQILRALSNLLRDTACVQRLSAMQKAEEVMHFFHRSEMKLPQYICAGDLMTTQIETLNAFEPLSTALNAFMLKQKTELPIVDDENHLLGIIDTHALLSSFIPTGLKKMFPFFQDTPTLEPLAQRMRDTYKLKVCEAINANICVCNIDTPAREIAVDFAEHNAIKCYVVDKEKHLIGVIPIAQFFSRILKD